jgi:hypothetical protein
MGACQRHIRDSLMPALEQHVRASLAELTKWRIESDPDDPDEQTVLFHYPAAAGPLYPRGPSLRVRVALSFRIRLIAAADTSHGRR